MILELYYPKKIGRITNSGEISEYDLPVKRSFPSMIISGPYSLLHRCKKKKQN